MGERRCRCGGSLAKKELGFWMRCEPRRRKRRRKQRCSSPGHYQRAQRVPRDAIGAGRRLVLRNSAAGRSRRGRKQREIWRARWDDSRCEMFSSRLSLGRLGCGSGRVASSESLESLSARSLHEIIPPNSYGHRSTCIYLPTYTTSNTRRPPSSNIYIRSCLHTFPAILHHKQTDRIPQLSRPATKPLKTTKDNLALRSSLQLHTSNKLLFLFENITLKHPAPRNCPHVPHTPCRFNVDSLIA